MTFPEEESRLAEQKLQDVVHSSPGTVSPPEVDGVADADMSSTRLAIEKCGSCGGQHTGLACHKYVNPTPPFTHWFTCPISSDPVGVTIKSFHGQNVHVNDTVISWLLEAQQSNSWIAFVGTLDGDRSIVRRYSCEFPHARFEQMLDAISNDLRKEFGPPQPDKPMENAGPLKPVVNLFGPMQ